jgi:hypothetical protein
MSPAQPIEMAGEEYIKGCLFAMFCAQDTVVVIPLQFVLLSSHNVSYI